MKRNAILMCLLGLLALGHSACLRAGSPPVRLRIENELSAEHLPSEGVPCVVATLPGQLTGSPFPYETKQETGPFSVELFWILSEGGSKYTASGRHLVKIDGPELAEHQEGRLQIVLLPGGKAEFHPELTPKL